MVNEYTGITEYYDLLMTSGYYDYQKMAKEVHSIVGDGCELLELGVGTALLAEQYMKIDPTCKFTGIDFTPSMIEIAKRRLGNWAKLIEADAITMDLKATFDGAIANGGVWGFLDWGDRWELASHIPDVEANRQGLKNLARHLREGGLLLLNRQKPHENYDKSLSAGIVYSQFIEEGEDTRDYYTIKKSYLFKKDGEIMAQEQLTLTYFKPEAYRQMLSEAGFDFQGTNNSELLAIYKKR
ncbi:MAG: class I SAM-dependent methyltransferase [Moorea sp. SIO1F2]|uniref:class I SAM-dependent methyltransferase n=1 Tax=unclassified Moorena TaxID=2683338 RepID=UPI0013B967FE|nr:MULTISPECIES: class I SAM-dependent methyltransferase [unclassified Moorena]NEO22439.1 class I SAM-dependent methyltransferase [Moorena sp. SIO4A5]NEO65510.1 class I SAM-dependent methyltransferase [Moorena sp. SIO4G2]NEQ59346.1 class I SAM-dependent methyltransferase [Moorena sp. SIO4A1]NET83730.1 class I SAM-dependent methyltransferase [Moorena sp. SIO1F2]